MQLAPSALLPEASYVSVDDIGTWNSLLRGIFRVLRATTDSVDDFRGSVFTKEVAGVDLIAMSIETSVVYRGSGQDSGDELNHYIVYIQNEGCSEITQGQCTATLQNGDLTIISTAQPVTIRCSSNCHSYCVKFPQQLLSVSSVYTRDLMAVRFAASDGLTAAIKTMITTLERTFGTAPPVCQRALALTTIDLITALIHSRTSLSAGRSGHVMDKALAEMQTYIDANLSDPELCPQVIADAHFTSLRRVYNIFKWAGLTVSGWINHRRLERCRRDLSDPLLSDVPVASVGLRWGFKTASHFGRSFKDAFGMTPGEYRSQALVTGPQAVNLGIDVSGGVQSATAVA